MAYTINGVGTSYLGVGPADEEGWRAATLCFVVAGMPLIPISRCIIRPVGHRDTASGESTQLEIAETSFPNLLEVLSIFFVHWCIHLPIAIGPIILALFNHRLFNGEDSLFGKFGMYIFVAAVIWIAVYVLIVSEMEKKKLLAPGQEPVGVWLWVGIATMFVVVMVITWWSQRSDNSDTDPPIEKMEQVAPTEEDRHDIPES